MYYEPHCDAQASALQRLDPVDIIVTPAVSQMLVSFPLVSTFEAGCLTAGCEGRTAVHGRSSFWLLHACHSAGNACACMH